MEEKLKNEIHQGWRSYTERDKEEDSVMVPSSLDPVGPTVPLTIKTLTSLPIFPSSLITVHHHSLFAYTSFFWCTSIVQPYTKKI